MGGAPGRVSIPEVCPRGGLQLEAPLSFADKTRLIEALAATGGRPGQCCSGLDTF
jgi:hypothetical protein